MPPRLLSLIAPPLCGVCGESCGSAQPACDACSAAIASSPTQPFAVPGVAHAWAATTYEGVPRRLIGALKFGKRLALAAVAAEAMAPLAPADGIVLPVPADPWRLRLRGFDPAAEIGSALSGRLDLPLSRCLERAHGSRQVGKARADRLAVRPRVRVHAPPPAKAILIDDVVTTGATLAACARALRAAGSEEILALTFARA